MYKILFKVLGSLTDLMVYVAISSSLTQIAGKTMTVTQIVGGICERRGCFVCTFVVPVAVDHDFV